MNNVSSRVEKDTSREPGSKNQKKYRLFNTDSTDDDC